MRVVPILLALVIGTLLPASALPTTSAADRVLGLIGTWQCESFAHSHGTWTFVHTPDGKISMRNVFKTADGDTHEYDESYAEDASGNWIWKGTAPDQPGLVQTARAGPWTSDTWTFQGQADYVSPPDGGTIFQPARSRQPLRMVYTALASGVFRREMEVNRFGRWVDEAGSTCTRANATPQA